MSLKLNFNHLSVFIVCSLSIVCGDNGDTFCNTPKGEKGLCQHIYDCTVLKDLLLKEPLSEEDKQLLYSSSLSCPQGSYVCCPTCYTIDGRIGTCVNYDKNPHYLSQNWEKLRKSRFSNHNNAKEVFTSNTYTKHHGCCDAFSQALYYACAQKTVAISFHGFSNQKDAKEVFTQIYNALQELLYYVTCCYGTLHGCYNSTLFCTEVTSLETRLRYNMKNPQCKYTVSWFPPDEDSGCCGYEAASNSRIAGGTNTSLEQHPWLAIIEYRNSNLELCGGGLISNRYVLTAAHCVNSKKRPVSVVLGDYDRSKHPDCFSFEGGKDCNNPVRIEIALTTVHPEYDEKDTNFRNDIALVTLARPAPYTDFIRPICLPTGTKDITETPPLNFQLLAAGWGTTETGTPSMVKLQVSLPFVNSWECSRDYLNMEWPVELWSYQMCAGGHHKDSCQGDSGSPLMYAVGSKHQVLGIVSSGIGECGEHEIPGIYTKVWNYDPWIRSNMKPWN